MRKPHAKSKLKTLPFERQQEIFDYLNGKDSEPPQPPHTLEETEAWLALDGLDTQSASLSDFYHWFPVASKMRAASNTTAALKEVLQELPELKLDEPRVSLALQRIFEADALKRGDSRLYVALQQLRQTDRSLDLQEVSGKTRASQKERQLALAKQQYELELEKFKKAFATKVEAGLLEIATQIKGNALAEAALKRLTESVKTT